ncbi:unnamed protein product [Peronospora belbahrii]|uniref:Uncharacterized protein n=1 Tax=Peronospora belbahrii TaxID=622444 RepID=A0ABN8CVK0_9STRA|nr:unnamed protein product [Peronospora belbahrii]
MNPSIITNLENDMDPDIPVLPAIVTLDVKVTIDNIKVGDPHILLQLRKTATQADLEEPSLFNRKENALPPATRGAVCDINAGGAAPIAQQVRPVAPKFREKLAELIKGLYRPRFSDHRHRHGNRRSW